MPRVRGFRDPRTLTLHHHDFSKFDRLLGSNSLRLATSRLSESALKDVLQRSIEAKQRHADSRLYYKQDLRKSPNDGQTIAIKDNFVTRDLPTTCASHILEGFVAKDATVVRLLKDAGMNVVVKTNMDEFGMGSHSTNSAYGAVKNGLWKNETHQSDSLSAGGSSGGSAVAVATGLVDAAIGSDTGGSVRLPAAYTGIVGFKPSYGRISRHGLIPYANSLDTVGVLGKTCLDVWIIFSLLDKYDSEDPTCLSIETRKRIGAARKARKSSPGLFNIQTRASGAYTNRHDANFGGEHSPRSGWRNEVKMPYYYPGRHAFYQQSRLSRSEIDQRRRIGVPIEYNIEEIHPSVRSAWLQKLSKLQEYGHEVVPVSLPSTQQALSAYYVLAPAEASSNLAKYDGVRYGKLRDADHVDDAVGTLYSEYRGAFFGEEVQRRILLGSFTLSAGAIDNYFIQAQKVRRIVQMDFDAVFRMPNPLRSNQRVNPEGVDYIVCPTAPTPPPKLSEVQNANPLDIYINDVFTVPASLAGLPAISIPAYEDSTDSGSLERTLGLQVIGQFGDDVGVIHFTRRWMEGDYIERRHKMSHGLRKKLT
ncbi:hypothetical protein R6Q59_009914 [Mikania micrantha]